MITLAGDTLIARFPEVHRDAELRVEFQRTLRIPDDGKSYPLPPGLGCFPLRRVDEHSERVPEAWREHGGVLLPLYQSEALWILFHSSYPFAVKVAAGKINAVTGKAWSQRLQRRPQDYLVIPEQPWLDGFCVAKGIIRQFVALPLGTGASVEEQLTGKAEHGGLQILVAPMKAEAYERRFGGSWGDRIYGTRAQALCEAAPAMGLAPGGRMRQEIYKDPHAFADWEREHFSRCFVHLVNSLAWRTITGEEPPATPVTAEEYARHGLPWFEYYDADAQALQGAAALHDLKSVAQIDAKDGGSLLPGNASVEPGNVVSLRGHEPHGVREGSF